MARAGFARTSRPAGSLVEQNLGRGAVHFADGMLYCLDEKSGDVALVEAVPDGMERKGRFKLSPRANCWNPGEASGRVVQVNGRLYLRDQQQYLFCFDVKGK